MRAARALMGLALMMSLACGPGEEAARPDPPATDEPAVTNEGQRDPDAPAEEADGQPEPTATAPQQQQPPARADRGPAPEIKVSPDCVRRLEQVTVTTKVQPDTPVSYSVTFSNGPSYDLRGVERSDGEGNFRWTFTVPATAADGQATVLLAATGGGTTGNFRVATDTC